MTGEKASWILTIPSATDSASWDNGSRHAQQCDAKNRWKITNSGNASGTCTLSRSANVLFDVPPVITRDLLLSTTVALGTNVTFSLTATGSPPLSYQWYSTVTPSPAPPPPPWSSAIISGKAWEHTHFGFRQQCAGGTNSQQCAVNVTAGNHGADRCHHRADTGQLWSNATFKVTGTAGDNVAVTNVYYSVNTSPFAPAMTANNWLNWSTNVT